MKATYGKIQQVHSLSVLSNAAFGIKFKSFDELQSFVTNVITSTISNKKIQACIGDDWQLVWGPVVFSNSPNAKVVVADNTMMLLYSTSQNLFTVAIAGTNTYSVYGWMEEDFKVNTTVKWKDVVNHPLDIADLSAISTGTYNGLQVLLQMKNKQGKTMIDALSDFLPNVKKGAEVASSGHSLGGALAPTMAMYLSDTIKKWDKNKTINTISAYPTAGPTPGNEAFAKKISKQITYQSNFNTLDVVPQAWQQDLMVKVPNFYNENIIPPAGASPANPIIGALCAGAILNTINKIHLKTNYQQADPFIGLKGTFNTELDKKLTKKFEAASRVYMPKELKEYLVILENFVRFLAQMGHQHLDAYYPLLNIETFATESTKIKDDLIPKDQTRLQATAEALHNTVKKITGFDLDELDTN